ncbi:ComEA family DNA-binding protein [Maridesulfovibrio sp.]|uniref:ComEA family DNA-binding protein n=1 Tax=Maridesulfovibrio sp. TaxID=2795000 RepID=UPI003BA84674
MREQGVLDYDVAINTANAEEISQLYGVGLVVAERIVTYREENGFFTRHDELAQVEGISKAHAYTLAPHIDWSVPEENAKSFMNGVSVWGGLILLWVIGVGSSKDVVLDLFNYISLLVLGKTVGVPGFIFFFTYRFLQLVLDVSIVLAMSICIIRDRYNISFFSRRKFLFCFAFYAISQFSICILNFYYYQCMVGWESFGSSDVRVIAAFFSFLCVIIIFMPSLLYYANCVKVLMSQKFKILYGVACLFFLAIGFFSYPFLYGLYDFFWWKILCLIYLSLLVYFSIYFLYAYVKGVSMYKISFELIPVDENLNSRTGRLLKKINIDFPNPEDQKKVLHELQRIHSRPGSGVVKVLGSIVLTAMTTAVGLYPNETKSFLSNAFDYFMKLIFS